MKKIILCADDYGQSAAISRGIFDLAAAGRLTAVSCMTESAFWRDLNNHLPALRDKIDIGLHFNLTHPFPDQYAPVQPLSRVLRASLMGNISLTKVKQTLHIQLDRFEQVMQQRPDFVDGHQHVHIFPSIRKLVLSELKNRYGDKKPYMRAVNPQLSLQTDALKMAFLKLLGLGFVTAAARSGMQTNSSFAGIYSFQPQANYSTLMRKWLHSIENKGLLMCHPGHPDDDESDPIRTARPRELEFLGSEAFANQLAEERVQLVRFSEL